MHAAAAAWRPILISLIENIPSTETKNIVSFMQRPAAPLAASPVAKALLCIRINDAGSIGRYQLICRPKMGYQTMPIRG